MADTKLETEVKLWAADLGRVEARLRELGAVLVGARVFERNSRYDRPDGSLTAAGIVLRLRRDTRTRLTYKEAGSVEDGILSRFEAEVEIGDFDTMALILERLGYVFSFAYEKYRTTYSLYRTEVTLDEMPFGRFVEVEGDRDAIARVLDAAGLEKLPRVEMSYAAAFNLLRTRLNLAFSDATFANFEGIALPGSIGELLTAGGRN